VTSEVPVNHLQRIGRYLFQRSKEENTGDVAARVVDAIIRQKECPKMLQVVFHPIPGEGDHLTYLNGAHFLLMPDLLKNKARALCGIYRL
jgi:hypothetical protein